MLTLLTTLPAHAAPAARSASAPASQPTNPPAPQSSKPSTFDANPEVQQAATVYAQSAVEHAKKAFDMTLDGSEASIAQVEVALGKLHDSYAQAAQKPTDDQVMTFAKAYGSYIGEVFRRSHGADWGLLSWDGKVFPGLRAKTGLEFWPWLRAFNRIEHGGEDNISDYYASLTKTDASAPAAAH
ncbi:hypothetical protein [Amantichitinum ursilacus]|uniref:hypothetical protein n=1 Tax=Amantichitinum ursilacus TaxID=857265 RepID=UPI0006B60D86|nr:hypothetical protein [Amantichitinum ursilacus]